MIKKTINIVHAVNVDLNIIKEHSIYAKRDTVYFVPDNCFLQDTVKAEDYRRLKRLMRKCNDGFINRLKFLFRGFGGVR
jgi:hypothetical protein